MLISILPIAFVKKLYTGCVESKVWYCRSVWGYCGAIIINHLQKLQNRAASISTESSFKIPIGPLIESLSWKTIREPVDE